MCILMIRCFVFASIVTLIGCSPASDGDSAAATLPDVDDSNAAPELPAMASYKGPPFHFEVQAEESTTQFRWSVTVPTGGWEMKFDGATTNPRSGHATIQVLLTRPGPGQIVTQAMQTLNGEYVNGAIAFTSADLVVKLITRGESADAADYARAAVWEAEP